ncbi:hypothetical protein BHE74_00000751 [Ensete ventricosum]|nr:hypothetical protein GW17_00016746 [Ensete ventricosum]RWW90105.1 hypothetical protein BHE74_00000751 [Ensete ventricosum]
MEIINHTKASHSQKLQQTEETQGEHTISPPIETPRSSDRLFFISLGGNVVTGDIRFPLLLLGIILSRTFLSNQQYAPVLIIMVGRSSVHTAAYAKRTKKQ